METIGLAINLGMRASGGASYKGGSSAVGGAGTLTAGVKLSFVAGIIAEFDECKYSNTNNHWS